MLVRCFDAAGGLRVDASIVERTYREVEEALLAEAFEYIVIAPIEEVDAPDETLAMGDGVEIGRLKTMKSEDACRLV